MNEYDYSSTGLALTRSFEGLRLTAYQDSAGVWTIGYGHTGPEVHHSQCIGEIEAETLLRSDLACAVRAVRKAVQVDLAQHQFDALVDFCFNVGRGSLLGSSLLRHVNRGEFLTARWCNSGCGPTRRQGPSGDWRDEGPQKLQLFSGHGFPFSEASTSDALNPHASTEVGEAEPESALALTGKGR